ncbi:hypothetical protein [Natrinema gelatinilyticum]|uniref:hypothetical protein n=1 Tax=Natrinema gelatinilyticum TaxID=2961571 RepID=UPI0020C31F46|nr:hypothetical protein [Natrinema gelatinilyticum]
MSSDPTTDDRAASGRDGGDDSSSVLLECPTCYDPVLFAIVTGRQSGTVEPCGCGVPPDLFDRIREE